MDNSTVTLSIPAAPNETFFQEGFWRESFPELSIGALLNEMPRSNGPSAEDLDLQRRRMTAEGYFQGRDEKLAEWAPKLAGAVSHMVGRNIPPPFIFLFDEAWACFHRLHSAITNHLGPNYHVLPDFWTWHIDPKAGEGGWTPHRDKGFKSLAADKSPLSLTIWIPLSEAKPLNGCMYILPADRDPVYGTPNDVRWNIELPSIRALPVIPGDFLCWNQAVLHWGARSSPFAEQPRMSMALEFQRADIPPFNQPVLPMLANMDFPSRLKLVAKQILQYQHMYPLSSEVHRLATDILARGG